MPCTALQGPTLNAVKYQVCRLMRMLVEITHTLEQERAARPTACLSSCPPVHRHLPCPLLKHPLTSPIFLPPSLPLCLAASLPRSLLPAPFLQVPDDRYLFCKLTYTDDTPEAYEPPMFRPALDGGVGCFSRMPFVM